MHGWCVGKRLDGMFPLVGMVVNNELFLLDVGKRGRDRTQSQAKVLPGIKFVGAMNGWGLLRFLLNNLDGWALNKALCFWMWPKKPSRALTSLKALPLML